MKFAITGATGFVGVHLIHHLLQKGHSVLAIKRTSSSLKEFELVNNAYGSKVSTDKLQWRDAELTDPELVDMFSEVDHVVHVAGLISYYKQDLNELIRVNADGTAHIVNFCLAAGVQSFCYVSSTAAISKQTDKEFQEEGQDWDDKAPHSAYGLSKYLGELEVWRAREEGLQAFIVNPGVILGYGLWDKSSNQLFKKTYNQFPFYSTGVTGFTGVHDLCEVIADLFTKEVDGQQFLVINNNASFKEIMDMMAEAYGKRKPFIGVTGFILGLMKALVAIKKVFGLRGLISQETVDAATSQFRFSNAKITKHTDHKFWSIEDCIREACEQYKKSPPK